MKKEELFEIIGDIDENFVEEARKDMKKFAVGYKCIIGLAIIIVAIIVGGVSIACSLKDRNQGSHGDEDTSTSFDESQMEDYMSEETETTNTTEETESDIVEDTQEDTQEDTNILDTENEPDSNGSSESGSSKLDQNTDKETNNNDNGDMIAEGLVAGGPLTWTLTVDGVLTLNGNRSMTSATMGFEWEPYVDKITSIIIGEGITTVTYSAFDGLPNLKSVYLSDTVTIIRKSAFANCTALEEVTIPASVEYIEEGAFRSCENLVVKIPENSKLTEIGYGAFARTAIKEFVAPDSLRLIEEGAFSNCASLESVILDGNLTLKRSAFRNCVGLKKMYIGEGVVHEGSIGECSSLEILENYSNMPITVNDYPKIKTLILGTKTYYHGRLEGCSTLETLVFGGQEYIEHTMFKDCTSLSSVTILEGVKSIQTFAFENTQITQITLPASITTIEGAPFKNTPLKEIVFKGDAPSKIVSSFNGLEATAYYPAGNPTWTQEVFDSFGGNITWVEYEPN